MIFWEHILYMFLMLSWTLLKDWKRCVLWKDRLSKKAKCSQVVGTIEETSKSLKSQKEIDSDAKWYEWKEVESIK
jgi:hypothetical protein